MTMIIDRRGRDGKNKSAVNRQRFIRRFKGQMKKAITDAIGSRRSITDVDKGEKANIPARDLSEPTFKHGQGGRREVIHPGNRKFTTGDKMARPKGGAGNGAAGSGQASNSGEGEDNFVFELSREEFLELFFEDLELPNLIRTQLAKVTEFKSVRAGFSSTGSPSSISIVRTFKGAYGRKIAILGARRAEIVAIKAEIQNLLDAGVDPDDEKICELRERIREIQAKKLPPFIDTFDLRYANRIQQPQPSTQAVMFCIMDVSGSMNEKRKDLAKRFFTLLYLFLSRNYERIDVIFIRHHTVAMEVDEQTFFHGKETGGTIVSSALRLMSGIVVERYPTASWNIYAAQASDGDNWHFDSPVSRDILLNQIMPLARYYAYVEITPDRHQSLWEAYEEVRKQCSHFSMRQIDSSSDIYPVFRDLFKRRVK
ncbi:MAG: YeaH/YhbH family protein [Candidatus Moraniibacteriota bacterium]|nr:MAG: YeaH/YhbH family protein [Candidatus Moranbacteria bacterium]